jgi:hypothetical protein
MTFKRNQVGEAISRLLDPESVLSPQDVLTRMKRLLDTDRTAPRSTRRREAKFAFFSGDPPGKGVENWFSSYEAFSLLNGIRLMAHGWPQGSAVSIMRRVRPELEKDHKRILAHDPAWLFDQKAIGNYAKPGDPAFDNRDPVFLTVVSTAGSLSGEKTALFECKTCQGLAAVYEFFAEVSNRQGALTMFEVATLAHRLMWELENTEPRSRGRN